MKKQLRLRIATQETKIKECQKKIQMFTNESPSKSNYFFIEAYQEVERLLTYELDELKAQLSRIK